jgi:hypothetical protein
MDPRKLLAETSQARRANRLCHCHSPGLTSSRPARLARSLRTELAHAQKLDTQLTIIYTLAELGR